MTEPTQYYLIGAGGTGAFLFPALVRLLENWEQNNSEPFHLTVIDGKTIDASKFDRQLFFKRFENANKANAIVAQYEADPERITPLPAYLGLDNLGMLKDGCTILIAADNWSIRQHIERIASDFNNVTVINGGNELHDGSVQVWLRRDGNNITPPLSEGHPELLTADTDMAELSCQQIAELPSGGQTMIANFMSACAMLNALRLCREWGDEPPTWNEAFFDMNTFSMRATAR